MLSSKLQEHGVKTLHSESDADLLIVQSTAVDSVANSATMVAGEDTDLLVLLWLQCGCEITASFLQIGKEADSKEEPQGVAH